MRHWQLSLLLPLFACAASCFNLGSGSDGPSPSSSSGATSSGGSSSSYVPPRCDQGCQDFLVGWALDATVWFIWNQKIAGHSAGMQDVMGTCPLGGTAHITGMTSTTPDGLNTNDIQLELDACEYSKEAFDLTFTGTVSMEGSFNSNTGFGAEVFTAPGLKALGTLHYYDDPAIDQSCDTVVSQDGSGDDSTLSGKVCGRHFDESSLGQTGGGSNTSGGTSNSAGSSSSAGSGSNNCACSCPNGSDCTGAQTPNPCGLDADGIPEVCGCPVGCK
ncbi:MAG TPA: hypothetical protein VHB79_26565 [Polyangiaceae bacterium]|nr:hypothetical protein [Polyangiaceae bacterium]